MSGSIGRHCDGVKHRRPSQKRIGGCYELDPLYSQTDAYKSAASLFKTIVILVQPNQSTEFFSFIKLDIMLFLVKRLIFP